MSFDISEKSFEFVSTNIKIDNGSIFIDESSNSEDFAYKSNVKDKIQQHEMCELTSTSYENYVNVSESNSRVTALIYFIGFKYITLVYLIIFVVHT